MGGLVGAMSTGKNGKQLFVFLFHGGRCPAGGVFENILNNRKICFIVFCQAYKTPNGCINNKEIKRIGFNSTALLAAFGAQFTWFSGWGWVERGVILTETNVRPPVTHRASGIYLSVILARARDARSAAISIKSACKNRTPSKGRRSLEGSKSMSMERSRIVTSPFGRI